MKVLLIKTSSLGDVIHALPAVTEASARCPSLELTWVVEEGLTDIPSLHPDVSRVIPVAIRRWRRSWWQSRGEIRDFMKQLRDTQYDLVIDTQGLLKSALLAALAHGPAHGYDSFSARESLASRFYQYRHRIDIGQHAVRRQKQLLAKSLGYEATWDVDYGIASKKASARKVAFLHGTTWPSKEWPVHCWQALVGLAEAAGFEVLVPAGSELEKTRAKKVLEDRQGRLLDRLPLMALAEELQDRAGVVSVDTGLGHLATAMGLHVTGIFGSTDPGLTAMYGPKTEIIVNDHLDCIPCRRRECRYPMPEDSSIIYPPCLEQTTPERVWQAFQRQTGSTVIKPD